MKIHLLKESSIRRYCGGQARAMRSFEGWLNKLNDADWDTPVDIHQTFGSADLLGASRVVFDIGGNNYRMICKYKFARAEVRLYVCWIGTHSEYDVLCARNEQYSVWEY